MKDDILYIMKYFRIVYYQILQWLLRKVFKTYPLIYDCSRCEDCGRNVHDFIVPDDVWLDIYGSDSGILCYDCFCDRSDRKYHCKRRISFKGVFK